MCPPSSGKMPREHVTNVKILHFSGNLSKHTHGGQTFYAFALNQAVLRDTSALSELGFNFTMALSGTFCSVFTPIFHHMVCFGSLKC